MNTVTMLLLSISVSLTSFSGSAPAPLADHTVQPAPIGSHSVQAEAASDMPDDYYTRRLKTLEGKLTGINVGAMTATVNDDGATIEFAYDEFTVFMRDFRPVEPSEIKPGARVVGLFDDSDGRLYIRRLVEISTYKKRRRYR